jgi:hypothetical protein
MSDAPSIGRHLATFNLFREADGSLQVTIADAAGVRAELNGSGAPLHLCAMNALRAALAGADKPEVDDFVRGAVSEADHQRARWGADHDGGKTPGDWFWLVGYLAQKALMSAIAGNVEKAKHHCITTAAALALWHAQIVEPVAEPAA